MCLYTYSTINQSNTIITGDLISSLLSSATLFMKCEIHFRIVITTKETQHSDFLEFKLKNWEMARRSKFHGGGGVG